MTAYETMYILRPDLGEEAVNQGISKYQSLLQEKGAESIDVQYRGRRRLAYEIQRFREGSYVQMNYEADGTAIAALERAMRLNDDVIRYLTIRSEPGQPASSEDSN